MDSANFSLSWIDYLIVVVYFIGVIAHGLYVSRKNRDGDSDSYFLAGRSIPWYLIGFSLFASNMRSAMRSSNAASTVPGE